MATISNRSRYEVSVPRKAELKRHFPYVEEVAAQAYFRELKSRGLVPTIKRAYTAVQFDTLVRAAGALGLELRITMR